MLHLAHSSAHLRHLRDKHAQSEQDGGHFDRPSPSRLSPLSLRSTGVIIILVRIIILA